MELIAKDINKIIKGKTILSHVSLTLESGNIYGFVGPNGAGKTMLFKALSGLMKVSSGEVYLDGKLLHRDFVVLPDLGIMIENAGLYPELSGFENLKTLTKLNKNIKNQDIKNYIKMVGLDPDDKKPFKNYSLGMKQRLVFAQAIMENPSILMLDEPTNALDKNGIVEIRKLILAQKERGAIVLIASHNEEDINALADVIFDVADGCVTIQKGDVSDEG